MDITNIKFITMTDDETINKEKFNPVINALLPIKPSGGLWASVYRPYIDEENYFINSEWDEFIQYELNDKIKKNSICFNIKQNSKIMIIDNENDCNQLFKMYESEEDSNKFLKFLDFEKMVVDGLDGIYLTSEGQQRTRLSFPYNLYGWDVESLLLFNLDVIKEQCTYTNEYLEKQFRDKMCLKE